MEKFKVVERETKTKAYSKEGNILNTTTKNFNKLYGKLYI